VSQENVDVVQAAFAAYFAGDEASLRELITPNVVISPPPDQPEAAGDYHGYDGFTRVTSDWLEAWDAHTLEVVRVQDLEDFVFVTVRQRARGRSSGVPLDNEVAFAFAMAHGKIARLQMFPTEREALEAVGLAE
jgi:ketosteroid isomerase-like protein